MLLINHHAMIHKHTPLPLDHICCFIVYMPSRQRQSLKGVVSMPKWFVKGVKWFQVNSPFFSQAHAILCNNTNYFSERSFRGHFSFFYAILMIRDITHMTPNNVHACLRIICNIKRRKRKYF